ncbi:MULTISPECIES: hypothetical protein [Pimelobacter]|uniref:hypothetical protein n=1 Tax=Pimelobacter TaxID=2044 RepID=UPI001C0401CD|nr:MULTISPECIES: hypothetical protein [Pimelobacter]MBU2698842.1 hypothetical protein [Pimelobacter sp. 30-1]UUW93032.1 hypothetical protein M0M43_30530 [Pimelobacter simplex]UUW99065.1 hypothetical protein M0M48_30550 [Pimelobacter simplex]
MATRIPAGVRRATRPYAGAAIVAGAAGLAKSAGAPAPVVGVMIVVPLLAMAAVLLWRRYSS